MSGKLIHIFNFCKSVDIKIQLAGNAQIYLLSASAASNTMRLDIFHPKKKSLHCFQLNWVTSYLLLGVFWKQ